MQLKRFANHSVFSRIVLAGFLSLLFFGCPKYRPVTPPVPPPDGIFSLVIASDPQLYWYSRPDGACKNSAPPAGTCAVKSGESKEDCFKRCGKESNDMQVKSIAKAGALVWPVGGDIMVNEGKQVRPVLAGMVNGDLTSYWHKDERNAYLDYYQDNESSLPEYPLYVGIGNHDYANNTCDCYGFFPWTSNSCARDAVASMRSIYEGVDGISFDSCSLAYSLDIGDFHIVQLHLNPSYSVDLDNYVVKGCVPDKFNISRSDCSKNKIGNAFSWLQTDLASATTRNKYIILNVHTPANEDDGGKYWGNDTAQKDANKKSFIEILQKSRVVAMFAGHIHEAHGYMGEYSLNGASVSNVDGRPIPWFRSGASEYYTYLVAELGKDSTPRAYMNVGVVSSMNGNAEFIDGNAVAVGPKTFWLE